MNYFARIIQITDLHITAEGEITKNGIDTQSRTELLLNTIKQEAHDLLVISGDICYAEGDKETYLWLKKQLEDWPAQVQIIGGNHDDLALMHTIFTDFPDYTSKEAFSFMLKEKPIFFLETGDGYVSQSQFAFLQNSKPTTQNTILLFMHHPPFLAHVKHMDSKYFLRNYAEMETFLNKQTDKEFVIFCGHYHVEKSIKKKNVTLYITPSPFFNMDPDFDGFRQENTLIPYRVIDVYEDEVDTRVKFATPKDTWSTLGSYRSS